MAWNGYRHLELYYAVSAARGGRAAHAEPAPARADSQLAWIAEHAQDQVRLCFDAHVPAPGRSPSPRRHCPGVQALRADVRPRHMPADSTIPGLLCYEDLIDAQDGRFAWPEFDENTASGLCYTSGTTGNPKARCSFAPLHRCSIQLRLGPAGCTQALGARRASCPWCRCSTSTRGACRIRCRWSGPSWCCRAPSLDGTPRSTNCSSHEKRDLLGRSVPTVWQWAC
ncbi:hypothetical protein ACU4GD_38490 [Cupriavidus basilensis]